MKDVLFFDTESEFEESRISVCLDAAAIVVAGIIIKNRFGPDRVPYCGHFGICSKCRKEIKERILATSTYVGCMR